MTPTECKARVLDMLVVAERGVETAEVNLRVAHERLEVIRGAFGWVEDAAATYVAEKGGP
jgi:hypothetical protein